MTGLGVIGTTGIPGAVLAADPEPSAEALEFFEKRIRPVLVEHCLKCHGPTQQKGGLRVDSRNGLLKGGESGTALVPGEVSKSPLIDAVSYDPDSYQMPPTGKLPDAVIADLTEWVKSGAVWPRETAGPDGGNATGFDLAERATHWSFQPVQVVTPPDVKDPRWAAHPIDRFIRARQEAVGLKAGPPAAPRTLFRRATWELTGLPPSPEALAEFADSDRPDAWERAVDELLASPRYGERWGRHWLDLVRFAETSGHEFDYEIPFAWPYRDYVVRAFNADVPYDLFVREHIAGDLLPQPRRDPVTGRQESIIGTASYWFAQGKHSPVDIRAEECDLVDNQLDVFGKTFLGLTIACTRCHDHKFDPISQKDYYALAGYLQTSRQTLADIAPPEQIAAITADLRSLDERARPILLRANVAKLWEFVAALPELLDAKLENLNQQGGGAAPKDGGASGAVTTADARRAWRKTVIDQATADRQHPWALWARWSESPAQAPQRIHEWRKAASRPVPPERDSDARLLSPPFATPATVPPTGTGNEADRQQWFVEGPAFQPLASQRSNWWLDADPQRPLKQAVLPGTWAHSGLGSPRFRGTLRSPTFTVTTQWIDYYLAKSGGDPHVPRQNKVGQVHLIVDGFQFIRNPLYGHLTIAVDASGTIKRYRQNTSKFLGQKAYIEIEDLDDGVMIVDRIEFRDSAAPRDAEHPLLPQALLPAPADDLADVTRVMQDLCDHVLNLVEREAREGTPAFSHPASRPQAEVWNWLLQQLPQVDGVLGRAALPSTPAAPSATEVADLVVSRADLESRIPNPEFVIAITDGTPEDEHLLIRGNHKKAGEVVPRRFLEVLAPMTAPAVTSGSAAAVGRTADVAVTTAVVARGDVAQPVITRTALTGEATATADGVRGSGRLDWAARTVAPTNPLTARVLVNRLWQHHFGRGLVPTPDDFGRMGQPASHPELLDWLAAEFIRSGWSIKHMQRLILTSQTYRLSSVAADPLAAERDPSNLWLTRQTVQRLEAEAIRDGLLWLSGRLDERLGGPSVLPHLTPFMEGRGRPGRSGPLDGAGRRSLYINVRRNFLSPMFLAFDFPTPFTTMGKRSASNVPAQALTMMNNPLVVQQTQAWADRVLTTTSDPATRVTQLYQLAYGRDPSAEEQKAAVAFIGATTADPQPWRDLAHVLVNVKEFFYVE